MAFYPILIKAHSGMAMLLVLLAVCSLLMAMQAAVGRVATGPMKIANITGLMETIIAGVVALSGFVLMFAGPWPWTQLWLLFGLLSVIVYSVLLKRVTKPARLAVAEGEGAGRWFRWQFVHVVILFVVFALMKLKAF